MANWILVYPFIGLLLVGFAIYEHINSAALSLPISPPLTIITALLPFLAVVNAIYYPRLVRSANTTGRWRFLGIALQGLQAILTTVLATLFLSNVVPSPIRKCILSTTWQRLFSAHDADSIRRIQDTLNCCGFNTVRDRAWPFPGHQTSRECSEIYGRTTACSGPWRAALQRNAGLEFGVVLSVGVLQVVVLVLVEILSSFYKMPQGRIFRHVAENDPERARLLPGDDEPGDDPDRPRLLPAGEDEHTERRGVANSRGTDPPDGNPWEGE